MFEIEHIIPLGGAGLAPQVAHEPNSDVVVYYQTPKEAYMHNRSDNVELGKWGEVEFADDDFIRFTHDQVTRFGVKSAIGIGGYGFYVDKGMGYTHIRIPINRDDGQEPPTFTVGQTETTITYTVANPIPSDQRNPVLYESFRFEFIQGKFSYEFITYDKAGEFEKPWDMNGAFEVRVRGHRNEIQNFSRWTRLQDITITLRPDQVAEGATVPTE